MPTPARVIHYPGGRDLAASRDFYVDTLGFRVVMTDPVLCLDSPANPGAQLILLPPGDGQPRPGFGVDLGAPAAVDAVHAEALRRGLRIEYPLTDEPWGVHRFFLEDPGGTIVNILAHNG